MPSKQSPANFNVEKFQKISLYSYNISAVPPLDIIGNSDSNTDGITQPDGETMTPIERDIRPTPNDRSS